MRSVSKGQLVLGALSEHHTALTPSPASAFWGPPVQGALKSTSSSSFLSCIDRSLAGVVQPRESTGSVRYCPSFVTEADGKSFN